ncbi:MAG: alpha/beta fold hydrolase, partial [Terriglobus roseus]|nr:alpha/beta fold hydrolase [Terriglobus roseus]
MPAIERSTEAGASLENVGRTQRLHFVHKRSEAENAIPLLFCHGWPGSFIEVSKVIDALSEPGVTAESGAGVPGADAPPAFHVVVPSIPGFGFSDASPDSGFGLAATADCFDALMRQLGYGHYVAHGSGWGFAVCRALSLRHPSTCAAVHVVSPVLPSPKLARTPLAALKFRIARWTRARYDLLAFGYTPGEVVGSASEYDARVGWYLAAASELEAGRPQTRAYGLTDSPAGLLACVLDQLKPPQLHIPPRPQQVQHPPPVASSSKGAVADSLRRTAANPFMEPIRESIESGLTLRELTRPGPPAWSPSDILNWAMMMWLPGPESGLRWLNRAAEDS